jgi:hypothetical protein
LSATLLTFGLEDWRAMPWRSDDGKGGTFVVSLRRAFEAAVVVVVVVVVVVELLRGRVGVRLESLESGEGPCALVLAQERMRSIYDGVLVEAFFIDVETRERWSCP